MILKEIDSKEERNRILNELYGQATTQQQRYKIKKDIEALNKGYKGEKEAAYYINELLSESKAWVVIHDLRLELRGRSAQIDHILVNRIGLIWVVETKNWSSKIIINKHGEFEVESNGKKYGVESPIEQNKRHIDFLKWYMEENRIIPEKLGVKIKPEFVNMVLLPKTARIKRPLNSRFDTTNVIRVDRLASEFDKFVESVQIYDAWKVLKIISEDKLHELCRKLISGHTVKNRNYYNDVDGLRTKSKTNESGYFCASCRKTISSAEAKFCWSERNKRRFNGRAYCRECQGKVK